MRKYKVLRPLPTWPTLSCATGDHTRKRGNGGLQVVLPVASNPITATSHHEAGGCLHTFHPHPWLLPLHYLAQMWHGQ